MPPAVSPRELERNAWVIAFVLIAGIAFFLSTHANNGFVIGGNIQSVPTHSSMDLPPCPSGFADVASHASGRTTTPSTDMVAACGSAQLDCDPSFDAAQTTQGNELRAARAACEAVQGCVLTSSVVQNSPCACDPLTNCRNINNNPTTPPVYSCTSTGTYDLGHYVCARPKQAQPY